MSVEHPGGIKARRSDGVPYDDTEAERERKAGVDHAKAMQEAKGRKTEQDRACSERAKAKTKVMDETIKKFMAEHAKRKGGNPAPAAKSQPASGD